jgi:hypothetical protein
MLDAVPPDRMVQLRYPQFKAKVCIYGVNWRQLHLRLYLKPMHLAVLIIARVGYHNDCFDGKQ